MAIIGIDLGTTNSLACVCQEGGPVLVPNSLGETLTPSVVSVDENGEICVGAVAKERLISHPEAAALAASCISGEDEGSYLVFDLGGGTLDVSVLDYFTIIFNLRLEFLGQIG